MESVVMDIKLADEGLKSDHSKVSLGNNEQWDSIKQSKEHQANDHITWDCGKQRMEKTSWFGHIEFEKPIEFSSRVNQICSLLKHAFEIHEGTSIKDPWTKLKGAGI